MCRMLAYVGAPIRLAALVDEPPHSLLLQSYRARELEGAVVNADGWGAGLYLDGDERACLYRSTLPIWADVNREHLGRAMTSRHILAAVRSATDPLSISVANTQPFGSGPLTFLHNGFVDRFTATLERPIRDRLSQKRHAELRGNTDSEHVFALLGDEWDARAEMQGEARLVSALNATLAALSELAVSHGTKCLMSVIVSDGKRLVSARTAAGATPPSLYVRAEWRGDVSARLVASEALDEAPGWQPVLPGHFVVLEPGRRIEQVPLS